MSVGDVLLHILVVLVAAKVAAEAAERMAVPAVVGEIVAGVVVGPSVLDLVGDDQVLRVLGELGVILLLLEVGMQMDLAELGAVGRASLLVAATGVVVPFALGYGVASAFGEHGHTALFVGAALTATSVGITARVFGDLRALATPEARIVLGAAVADDVMGLVILTVVVRIVSEGSVSVLSVLGVVAVAVAFLVATTLVGLRAAPHLFGLIHRRARSGGTLVATALAFTLAFAQLASAAKLAPIVGAFVAGLALARSDQAERIRRELTPVGHLFVPVFFLEVGIDARIGQFARPAVLGLAAALLVVAVAGKLVSPIGALGVAADKALVGLGMIPRGEVGLIFATLGLRQHVLGQDLYAALLLVVLATTLVAPPLLKWRIVQLRRSRTAPARASPMPVGGWLEVRDGVVDLAARPPTHLALSLALDAALLVTDHRPGPGLLDWLGEVGDEPLRWDETGTNKLFALLRDGNARSWRFLEMSGVLELALPELAATLRRRRADPFELDATSALRWSLLERVHELIETDPAARREYAALRHPEWLLLGGLLLEAADGDGTEAVTVARRLAARLDLGAEAEQELALLVGEVGLLRGAAVRPDGLDEQSVLPIATHVERPERARALYLLTLAATDLVGWERQRLDQLYELVMVALAHPELTSREAGNLVQRRRAEATRLVGGRPELCRRIEAAPRSYVLAQQSSDIARQSALLEPLPARGRTHVGAHPLDGEGTWRVEVASRDRPGLLAAISGALAAMGMTVTDAVVATWPDDGALESFNVLSSVAPDVDRLRQTLDAAIGAPVVGEPVEDAAVTFDDDASPWHTICEVRAPDRSGLLHALTAGFAAAGADVHAARVTTVEGVAGDRFELTDRHGHKLGEPMKTAIRDAFAGRVTVRRRSPFAVNRVVTRRRGATDPGDRGPSSRS